LRAFAQKRSRRDGRGGMADSIMAKECDCGGAARAGCGWRGLSVEMDNEGVTV